MLINSITDVYINMRFNDFYFESNKLLNTCKTQNALICEKARFTSAEL